MSINNPKVSVIIPTYNRANVVCNAVDSVINQTYKNIEIIVVDDGSTDDTKKVLNKYAGNIKYIKQSNQGVSSARNLGIKESTGEYLAFIDSDDVWHSDKVQKQLDFFNSNKNNNIGLVYTNTILIDKDNQKKKRRDFFTKNESGILEFIDVFKDPYLGLPTVMILSSVINKVGLFDEGLETAEDIDLYLRISEFYKIGYIHDILVDVHQSENSLSEKLSSYQDNIDVVTKFVDKHHELFEIHSVIVKDVLYKINLDYARTLLWNGLCAESRERIRDSIKYKFTFEAIFLLIKSYLRKYIHG